MDAVVRLGECLYRTIPKVQKPNVCQSSVYAELAAVKLYNVGDRFISFAPNIVKYHFHKYLRSDPEMAVVKGVNNGNNGEEGQNVNHSTTSIS